MPHSSHSDSIPRERVRRREKGNLSSEQGGQTSDRKHTLKKRENVLRRSASCGPLRGEMEETKEEERWCLAPDYPDSSSTVQAAGGLEPRALTTGKKHRLCVNDRVVLEGRRRGEERRRGAVRFIGPLENTESTDIYIGVELDTASGENEGSLHGNRYFRCKPNHGTFTTITGIRKLSRSSHSKPRSSKPPEEGDSSDSGPGSSAVAIGRSSQIVGSRNGLRRTWNQMDIRAQVHSEPGGPRDKTTVENPGLN
ncbi:CAP-Gly domain-containing linker protein 4-like isoform X3 [Oncorhynchus keta]|uniref:CAP-Gly domain-containing linker protein 4-like isoform X3 n=1 Tax=Oncorhynchus keta TaxID=8018 RepID=UPI00227B37D6|nr:CAP-Gly domain-containing linker protein 4-like isoform X3 [Oncorhynchus keta]